MRAVNAHTCTCKESFHAHLFMPTTSFVLSFHRHFVFTKKAASYGDKLVVGLGEWGGDEWGG